MNYLRWLIISLLCCDYNAVTLNDIKKVKIAFTSALLVNAFSNPYSNAITIPIDYKNVHVCKSQSMYLSDLKKGSLTPGEETEGFFHRAKQLETDGEFALAQQLYEQIVEIDPDFIYAWSSLGNVLSAQGDLKNALLCYKKSLSLLPPRTEAAMVLLNKAVIETALGQDNIAIDDLNLAEKISGSNDNIIRAKAVAYSDLGDWKKSCELFSQVISSADRNAQPWWLRYSMSLFEASRGVEAVAYLQRTLNRFPDEVECKAFATALYQGLGSREEANSYWKTISRDDQILYSDESFLKDKLHWGSESITSLKSFINKS